jgi:hypothetical protein
MNWPKQIWSAAFWLLVVGIGLTYFHPSRDNFRSLRQKESSGYYGALSDAFLSGQVSMKELPDPRLLKSENPYVVQLDIPRPHDMSLYKGKLYLYFGPAPAIILFIPWRLISGAWLEDQGGTKIFCIVGLILGATLMRRIWRRHFEDCGEGWLLLGIAVLGWGSPIFYLSQNPTFYAVPISAAFCCIMAVAVLVERALASETTAGRIALLASASLAYGFAVGSRPNYLFGLPVLLVPGLYLYVKGSKNSARPWLSLVAAILPAAIAGLAIAAYNYARFDSPFEFGMRFALMPEDMRHARLMGFENLRGNLSNYLFRPALYVRYYPFFLTNGAFGMVPYLPFSFLGPVLIGISLLNAAFRKRTELLVLCLTLLGVASGNLFSLGLFYYFGELRYMADFVPVFLLLGTIGAFALSGTASNPSRTFRIATSTAAIFLAVLTLGDSLLAANQSPSAGGGGAVAKRMDRVVYAMERAAGTKQGPIQMDVQFPTGRDGIREPILSTGVPGQGDILYIEYLSGMRARLGLFHIGSGGPTSHEFSISPGPHRVTVSLGSLYPPIEHPLLAGYPRPFAEALKRRVEVTLDSETVMSTSANFYFATPGLLYVGANRLASDVSAPAFTGVISNPMRMGLPPVGDFFASRGQDGPLRLRLRFPELGAGPGEPLVCTGKPGAGDIFFVTFLGRRRIRFGIENSGDVLTSDPVDVNTDQDHVVDLEMGSLYPPGAEAAGRPKDDLQRLRTRYSVRLDGKLLIEAARNFRPSEHDEVVCAVNSIGATTAVGAFSGSIYSTERIPPPAARGRASWGPLDAWVIFPRNGAGLAEPLVTTGVAGKGDVIYVKSDSEGRLSFGLDHWSVGGPIGKPVPVDFSKAHHLEVTMGSLFPPAGDPQWLAHPGSNPGIVKGLVRVRLDDAIVLEGNLPTYDAGPDQLVFWLNPIGASSCLDRFSGTAIESREPTW